MELISRISKGSRMDQVYIPKNRAGLSIGEYVVIKPLQETKLIEKPYFYHVISIEPIKINIVEEIFRIIDKNMHSYENILITGSFLENGFDFNDLDILIINETCVNIDSVKDEILSKTGIKPHIIQMDNKTILKGLSTDPLYQSMLSKFIAKKRTIFKVEQKINYHLLDLHLLKSKIFINNFDILNGDEKYYLTKNMAAISLFLEKKTISKEKLDDFIKKMFMLKDIKTLKDNLLNKKDAVNKYNLVYDDIFKKIMEGIKNESK